MKALVPESGLSTFRKEMDRFLDKFWDGDEFSGVGAWAPDIDVAETPEALTIRAEVPGIDPKDLQVSVESGILTLRGDKRQDTERKDERLYRRERHYGSFSRSIRLPVNVDAAKVTAAFKNGVLTVVMPKTTEARGRAVPISIV
jgi:HSP20 family protein